MDSERHGFFDSSDVDSTVMVDRPRGSLLDNLNGQSGKGSYGFGKESWSNKPLLMRPAHTMGRNRITPWSE